MADIIGTPYGDTLTGTEAGESIAGLGGDDTLYGGPDPSFGNDTLDGGTGDDSLVGGYGDDHYYVDSIGDVVEEFASQGSDQVFTTLTAYTLGANVEKLLLLSGGHGYGNTLDNIMGTLSSATLSGGDGNDWLFGLAENDVLQGDSGNDTLEGSFGNDSLDGGTGDDSLLGQYGDDTLDAGTGTDTMAGGYGNDLYITDGADSLSENSSAGTDTVEISTGGWTLGANFENLILTAGFDGYGNSLDNQITGNAGVNFLGGGGGNDTLDGGLGNDTMSGGYGNDTYIVDSADDGLNEESIAGGTDTVQSYVSYSLDEYFENLQLLAGFSGNGNTLDNEITGNGIANSLQGFDGNDTLNGGTGADTMYGGYGDDVYYVDDVNDQVNEVGSGTDEVRSTLTYNLGAHPDIENLTLLGAALNGYGNALANLITGNTYGNRLDGGDGNDQLEGSDGNDTLLGGLGDDLLDSGTGADSLNGGEGNDTLNATGGTGIALVGGTGDDAYYVNNRQDVVVEAASEGLDTVYSDGNYRLGANIENLGVMVGNGTGNAMANMIFAIDGGCGTVVLTGAGGSDTLSGGNSYDILLGGGGEDSLDGGVGNDTMMGGAGNDVYSVGDDGDIVVEDNGKGTDTVQAFGVNYHLAGNVENLVLFGDALFGAGNELANTITGTSGDNVLVGGGDNDVLIGGYGSDVLDGGDGDDGLAGGFGDDVMQGGAGNDLYFVDNVDDVTIEDAGEGDADQVMSSVTWTLDDNVEQLQLTGDAGPMAGNINGTGNALANILVGNGYDNTLDGKGGADLMFGGYGNDTYIVNNAGDQANEFNGFFEGFDTVRSSVTYTLVSAGLENLVLTGTGAINGTGNDNNNSITGNAKDNALNGGNGNDLLTGGSGHDALTGGSGIDGFVYTGTLAAAHSDTITDFVSGSDSLELDRGVFTTLNSGDLQNAKFKSATDITATGGATVDDTDRILYDSDSGKLYYDSNGSAEGGRTLIFTLAPNTVLHANDIHGFGSA